MVGGHEFTAPVVARWGSDEPDAPVVVLLHGRGATELSMAALQSHLSTGHAYVAVRAPLAQGDGFAWFANRGIGRPVAESLAATMTWFRSWLDGYTTPQQPVVLLGFSGGTAFAGGLLLAQPSRFAGAVLLHGTLPFDSGVPVTPGRLAGVPVFLAQGIHDTVIPLELQRRTWDYLVKDSGSAVWAEHEPTGHELATGTVKAVGQWITERLAFLYDRGSAEGAADGHAAQWTTLPDGKLPVRRGKRPEVSVTTPQQQESQNAPASLQKELFAQLEKLEGVTTAPSAISVPGARAFVLGPAAARGPADAFIVPAVGEFAHLHPEYDGSLHLVLPIPLAHDALAKGWAVAHPLGGLRLTPGMVMIYGPRDDEELETVVGIVRASHEFASGRAGGKDSA